MSLSTYTALKTSVADWLNRTDLTTQIPDFVTLCEAKMKRRLRRTTTRASLTVAASAVTAPSDMAELRSIRLVSASPSQDNPIRVGTYEMYAERLARAGGTTGRPSDVCVFHGELLFAPAPDQSYTAEIVYFATLTPLSSTTASNVVLVEAPDAYLYGTLLEAAPYLVNDERIPTWKTKFDDAIDELNAVRSNEEHAASLRAARLPMVFG